MLQFNIAIRLIFLTNAWVSFEDSFSNTFLFTLIIVDFLLKICVISHCRCNNFHFYQISLLKTLYISVYSKFDVCIYLHQFFFGERKYLNILVSKYTYIIFIEKNIYVNVCMLIYVCTHVCIRISHTHALERPMDC